MITERDIEVGDRTVHVKLFRPTKERFANIAPDTVANWYCLFADTECEGVKAPPYSVTIPRAQTTDRERFQELLDEGMKNAAEECARLVGAEEAVMELPEG